MINRKQFTFKQNANFIWRIENGEKKNNTEAKSVKTTDSEVPDRKRHDNIGVLQESINGTSSLPTIVVKKHSTSDDNSSPEYELIHMFSPTPKQLSKPTAPLRKPYNGKRKCHVKSADKAARKPEDASNAGNRDAGEPPDAARVAAENSTENLLQNGNVSEKRKIQTENIPRKPIIRHTGKKQNKIHFQGYVAEKIIKKRKKKGKIEYCVKWTGFEDEFNTWYSDNSIVDKTLVDKFEQGELMSKRQELEEKKIKKNRKDIEAKPAETADSDRKRHDDVGVLQKSIESKSSSPTTVVKDQSTSNDNLSSEYRPRNMFSPKSKQLSKPYAPSRKRNNGKRNKSHVKSAAKAVGRCGDASNAGNRDAGEPPDTVRVAVDPSTERLSVIQEQMYKQQGNVTFTEVTMNSITVIIQECNTDKGFFKSPGPDRTLILNNSR